MSEVLEATNYRGYEIEIFQDEFDENPIRALRESGVLARIERILVDSDMQLTLNRKEISESKSIDLPKGIMNRIARSSIRNRKIIDVVTEEVMNGRPCLVFTCGIEHSRVLAAALNLHGVRASYIDSLMSKWARRRAIHRFKQEESDVLVNFGVLTTGFDSPRIASVIIARPTSSIVLYSQMVGRGLRGPLMGGNDKCRLIDIKDNFVNFGNVEDVYSYFDEYWTNMA